MPAVERLTATVSTKGEVVLPKPLREQLQWGAGTQLIVEHTPEGVLLKAVPLSASAQPEDVLASLGEPKTLAEVAAGIAAEAKRRPPRGGR
jgi:AbrB family looped-hinge helix DNA binding protein